MGEICLSLPSILRCQDVSTIQSGALLIVTSVELLFSITLVLVKWGNGRRHLLLAAEGWLYYCLALLDFLSHFLPAARTYLPTLRALDLTIGALSFIPLFIYTLFLFLLLRTEVIPSLPYRIARIVRPTLLLLIPAIIATELIASFIGISYQLIPTVPNPTITIGFPTPTSQTLWTTFSSLSLSLLTSYQALCFCITTYHLIKSSLQPPTPTSRTEIVVQQGNGFGWVAAGIKFGAVESVVGFAGVRGAVPYGWEIAVVRRVLRLGGRVCLVFGVIKGVDRTENFHLFDTQEEIRERKRRSGLRHLISNPRHSTFQHLGTGDLNFVPPTTSLIPPTSLAPPTRTQAPTTSRRYSHISWSIISAPHPPRHRPTPLTLKAHNHRRSLLPSPTPQTLKNKPDPLSLVRRTPRPSDRVTIHLTPDQLPSLQIRLSSVSFPSPTAIPGIVERMEMEGGEGRGLVRSGSEKSGRSGMSGSQLSEASSAPWRTPLPTPSPAPFSNFIEFRRNSGPTPTHLFPISSGSSLTPTPPPRRMHMQANYPLAADGSVDSHSPRNFDEFVSKSPGVSVQTTSKVEKRSTLGVMQEEYGFSHSLSSRSSFSTTPDSPNHNATQPEDEREGSEHGSGPTKDSSTDFSVGMSAVFLDDDQRSAKTRDFAGSIDSAQWLAGTAYAPGPTAADVEAYRAGLPTPSRSQTSLNAEGRVEKGMSSHTLGGRMPWAGAGEVSGDEENEKVLEDAWKKIGSTRVVSVGMAPERNTPTPTRGHNTNASVTVEHLVVVDGEEADDVDEDLDS
ncbi:hypothetical protein JAAARDRAFT_58967 [Jaapia argillacea MUCL 33604]|uniref:Uncharacterized protein n=1 Tax=Jaapia argillacea MUCL 33604 TaxID=933084 RepID=A0A067PPI3_9AGAM|nr:hypothetical protein JAAARDRAFT_58967 [Jaapia argillacea MUCL 33604]